METRGESTKEVTDDIDMTNLSFLFLPPFPSYLLFCHSLCICGPFVVLFVFVFFFPVACVGFFFFLLPLLFYPPSPLWLLPLIISSPSPPPLSRLRLMYVQESV